MLIDQTTEGLQAWRLDACYSSDLDLPVLAEVDVVVIGAGAAGVAAATVAAEEGLRVALVEKYGFAGGAAVAGYSGTICGLYMSSEDPAAQEQLVYGFTQRFRDELARRGGVTGLQRYGNTWTVAHDPFVWRDAADALLTQAGVRIFYHTALTGVVVENGVHLGVTVESNAGRALIRAARTIDASGDAAVVARTGYRYAFGHQGEIQNPTMFFRLGRVDLARFLDHYGPDTICPAWVTDEIAAARESGADLPRDKIWVFETPHDGELLVNATRLAASGRSLNVIDPEDFTIAEIAGRRQVRAYAEFMRTSVRGCEEIYVVDTGVEAGIRQTRTIVGMHTLTNDDVVHCRKRDDAIVRSAWPIELHSGSKPKLHWLIGDYYDVPYGALVPECGENIIVAGRCLSAEHEALASCRVTAQCFEYGQAAALATVESMSSAMAYRELDPIRIRALMKARGSAL